MNSVAHQNGVETITDEEKKSIFSEYYSVGECKSQMLTDLDLRNFHANKFIERTG
jgi:hypothetical protein